ncbi:MAG: metal ABC transporter permease [bacterium]
MMVSLDIIILALLVASASAIPGVFLLLRKSAMLSDAISHSILLGIVLLFFWLKDIHSPFFIFAAALTGVLTVYLIEVIIQSKQVKKDAAIGLVFPCFFALAIILINLFARNVHLDQDAVLLGEIAFAPFERLEVFGRDLGPKASWVMGMVLLLNTSFVGFFYKELKITTFDKNLALILGITPGLIHYLLVTLVSITAVVAFDSVGAVLLVAFMITPAATATLLSRRLLNVLFISIGVACVSAITGYSVAALLDTSIAGAMATMCGLFFLLAFFLSPTQGLITRARHQKQKKLEFSAKLLTIQLLHHENQSEEKSENNINNLLDHMQWTEAFSNKVCKYCLENQWITQKKTALFLTQLGREIAKVVMKKT